MNKLLPVVFLSGVLLNAGCSKKNEFQAPPPPSVTVQHPIQKDVIVYAKYPGRTVAFDSVEIRARVRGFLKEIHFDDGQRVSKGELLFTIEPEEYEAAVKSAEAKFEEAKAGQKLAEARLTRIRQAFETTAVSEVDLLTAEAEQQSAEANVKMAEAALEKAKLDLSYTEIHAPLSGRMARRTMSAGNLVGNGESTLLSTLVSEAPMYVYFTVDERSLLPRLEEGVANKDLSAIPPVKLELADGKIHTEEGRVDYFDPTIDPSTGTLQARAVFNNDNVNLVSGLFGNLLVPQPHDDALLVPDLCVQRDMSGSFVLVVTDENKVENRYITPGPLSGDQRIVEDGLESDDRVIVKGIQRARPGITVQATMATAE